MIFSWICSHAVRLPRQAIRALVLAFLLAIPAAAPQAPQSPPANMEAAPANQDAEAKAAERRKHFEDEKRRLESDIPKPRGIGSQVPASNPNQTLFVSPAVVTMLVGDFHEFSAFEIEGKTVTASADWTLDNSDVITLSNNGGPRVTSKTPGRATLRARIGLRTAEAVITVRDGDKLPDGAILWSVPQIPGFAGKQLVQAVPTANGPDLYSIDQNEQGEQIVRAIFSDGRQLWMRKMPRTGNIVNAVPH
jgi:hypothetical protein